MKRSLKARLAVYSAGTASILCAIPAHAAIDVSNVVTEIMDLLTPIGLVGGAVLIIGATFFAYKKLSGFISR